MRLDLPCSSVNSPGHGTSLSGEVVAQVERVQVEEGGFGHTPDGALGYLCKHRIAQFIEERGSQPCSTIWCGRSRRSRRRRRRGEEEEEEEEEEEQEERRRRRRRKGGGGGGRGSMKSTTNTIQFSHTPNDDCGACLR